MFRFEDLEVYRRSLLFANNAYQITRSWPREHLYGLADQLRRAALSIPLNIAEGSSRSKKDFNRFLNIARGSCYECVPLIGIALQQGLISKEQKERLYAELTEISKMISGLKKAL